MTSSRKRILDVDPNYFGPHTMIFPPSIAADTRLLILGAVFPTRITPRFQQTLEDDFPNVAGLGIIPPSLHPIAIGTTGTAQESLRLGSPRTRKPRIHLRLKNKGRRAKAYRHSLQASPTDSTSSGQRENSSAIRAACAKERSCGFLGQPAMSSLSRPVS